MNEINKSQQVNNDMFNNNPDMNQGGLLELVNRLQQRIEILENQNKKGSVREFNDTIEVKAPGMLIVGVGQMDSVIAGIDSVGEIDVSGISVGKDKISGNTSSTNNAQYTLTHYPNDVTGYTTFFSSIRPPIYQSSDSGTLFAITNGGSTLVDGRFVWTTDELAGCIINLISSAGAFVESKRIASNTADTITITGTWASATGSYMYFAFRPVYLGYSAYPWRKFFVEEGSTQGIRFGIGVSGDGSNGALYMDATGDLYWSDKSATVTKLNSSGIPTGVATLYYGSTVPTGYLLCDGSAVSRTTYSTLFSVIGTTYGAGDGSTTFNIPDLRGRVPVGKDSSQTEFDTLGETGGAKTHQLTIAEMPAHTHTGGGTSVKLGAVSAFIMDGSGNTGSTGGDGAHNNLQPYQVTNYIIKT
jgi:microcystin-dependent protein